MLPKLRGLLALLGLTAIVLGMPALLIAAAPIGTLSITWTPEGIWQALATPDNGTIALALFKLVGWITWAILTIAVLLEIVGIVRHAPVPHLPGFAVPQLLVRRMVASAAVLFIATSSLTTSGIQTTPVAQTSGAPQPPVPAQALAAHAQPAKAPDRPHTYTVKKGDTLSQIALDHTGRASNYPKLCRASTHTVQPGGRHLTDPDEIDIGWKITIPAEHAEHPKPAKQTPAKEQSAKQTTSTPTTPSVPAPTPAQPPSVPASSQPTTPPTQRQPPPTAAATPADTAEPTSESPGWVLGGLAGAGALLAGSLYLALGRRRAAQFRHRRPGRMIAMPPADTIPVEQTLIREGRPTGALVLLIDEVLRRTTASLTEAKQPVPVLVGVDAHPEHLTLRFAVPVDLPSVWTCLDPDTRQIWRIATDADLDQAGPLAPDSAPPWPQLVTLGRDSAGWRLVNLETLGVATLTGDPINCRDLARYLASELAVSPWARDVTIDCLDICAELPGLAPDRLRFHTEPGMIPDRVRDAVATADRLTAVKAASLETARITYAGEDLWDSRLLITATTDAEHLDVLTRLLGDQKGRTATSLLVVAPAGPPVGTEIKLTDKGRVRVRALELDLVANGLTEDEAHGCIALITAGRNLDDTPMPVVDDAARGRWNQFCDEAGAVRPEMTVPRDTDDPTATSVLPEPDEVYVGQTANTSEDVARLGPKLPATVAEDIDDGDPTLDDDLAEWWADSCRRPRLRVLGPVKVRIPIRGDASKAIDRMPACVEAVAYLSTRPGGATTQEVADALGISDGRVRQDMSIVRAWLGDNPRTGRTFLPGATGHPLAIERGIGLYLIEDLLCDADLFKRLRLRGQARGADGLEDLRTALRLVNGVPFEGLRSRGSAWLASNPIDQHLLCSIVDVAHIVSTIALESGDIQQARAAADLAGVAAPTEATPQFDLAAIAEKIGDHARAAEIARTVVKWRDAAGEPLDLSQRNDAILRAHLWLERVSYAS